MELVLIVIELIIADLVLGGDNAVVISLATKSLPQELKLKASVIGAFFAIILRVIFILIILMFGEMHIILLNIIAGLLLIKIAYDLIKSDDEEHNVDGGNTLMSAVKTIVIADAVMSFDNAVVIASIAQDAPVGTAGEIGLIVMALLVSFPIILFGAQLLSKVIEKYTFVVYLCGILLIHIGVELFTQDSLFKNIGFDFFTNISVLSGWVITAIVFTISYILINKNETE